MRLEELLIAGTKVVGPVEALRGMRETVRHVILTQTAVEVDFDDEGWFEGTVVGVGRGGRGFVYRVAPSPPGEEGRDRGAGVAVSSTLLLL